MNISIWLLGSSIFSAQLAATRGLPFAFAIHFAPEHLESALNIYRERFQPSKTLQEPYAMAAVNVFAADRDGVANRLFTSIQLMAWGMVRRNHGLLQPPVNNMDDLWDQLEKNCSGRTAQIFFCWGPSKVKKGLESFLNRTQADEIMAVSHIYNHVARLRSFELLSSI